MDAFHPFRVAWVEVGASHFTANVRRLSSRGVPYRPKDESQDPSVARAVPRSQVTVIPRVAVGVVLPLECGVVRPYNVATPIRVGVLPGNDNSRIGRSSPVRASSVRHLLVFTNLYRYLRRVVTVGDKGVPYPSSQGCFVAYPLQLRRPNGDRWDNHLLRAIKLLGLFFGPSNGHVTFYDVSFFIGRIAWFHTVVRHPTGRNTVSYFRSYFVKYKQPIRGA